MADFPLRWRLVLLSGEERVIELRRDVHDRWIGVVEIEGRLRLTSPQSTAYAALNWSVARFEMYRELTPATEPRRAELVAALRAMVRTRGEYSETFVEHIVEGRPPTPEEEAALVERAHAAVEAISEASEMLSRCP